MELYDNVSRDINKLITTRYSTSFGLSSTLFDRTIRPDIYSIYGLVRVADEIVDTYRKANALELLDELEADCYRCMKFGYSANPVVHAYGLTARKYGIPKPILTAFFASMRMDIRPFKNTRKNYDTYIYGSAEAVGLMCLRVFVAGDNAKFDTLSDGARALGAAYQKINFLRDLATDSTELERWYFPGSTPDTFDEKSKATIVKEIEGDIDQARTALAELPKSSNKAVRLSLEYYQRLLEKLKRTSVDELRSRRLRVSNGTKLLSYAKVRLLP